MSPLAVNSLVGAFFVVGTNGVVVNGSSVSSYLALVVEGVVEKVMVVELEVVGPLHGLIPVHSGDKMMVNRSELIFLISIVV